MHKAVLNLSSSFDLSLIILEFFLLIGPNILPTSRTGKPLSQVQKPATSSGGFVGAAAQPSFTYVKHSQCLSTNGCLGIPTPLQIKQI